MARKRTKELTFGNVPTKSFATAKKPNLWNKLGIPYRVQLAKACGFDGKLGSKEWSDLTKGQRKALETAHSKNVKEDETMAKKRQTQKKSGKGKAKKATKKQVTKKSKKARDDNGYGKRRSAGNEDPVAVFITENVESNDDLRSLAYVALTEVSDEMTELKFSRDNERIAATATRSNQGLARMTLGLMIRKYVRLADRDAKRWLTKLWKEIS